jgi:hypothetical protein
MKKRKYWDWLDWVEVSLIAIIIGSTLIAGISIIELIICICSG